MEVLLIIDLKMYNIIIEYIESIKNKISNSRIIVYTNIKDILYSNQYYYIFFGIHFVNFPIINETNVYYINLEQLTRDGTTGTFNMLNKVITFRNLKCNLLDYSDENCNILKKHNIQSVYLPYQVNLKEIYNYKKEYDFVTCCTWNKRIENIYKPLSQIFKKSYSIGNPILWGKKRDNILLKSKVLINIHHIEKDYFILEEIRITRCIINKIIVISEDSLNQENYILSKFIIFTNYDNLVAKTTEVLNNYEYYYDLLYKDLDVAKINNELEKYVINFRMGLDKLTLNSVSL